MAFETLRIMAVRRGLEKADTASTNEEKIEGLKEAVAALLQYIEEQESEASRARFTSGILD